jgi:D-lyxose ketol-isomerase
MKRSDVNQIITQAEKFLESHSFKLPPWAFYKPEDWKGLNRDSHKEILVNHLGWDVTDMGSGDFNRRGLVLFTIRNGGLGENQKPYAEKIMVVKENQETALHFHADKVEDIINRGGGVLVLELFNSDGPHELKEDSVQVIIDGVLKNFEAGERVFLKPGESITLRQGVFHRFYAQEGHGTVLAGEVSAVNDDETDNYFYESLPRYPALEEDETPVRLLCTEYEKYI